MDEIAKKLGLDPIELRMMNAAREGTKAAYGPKFGPIGLEETLNSIKKTEHWNTPLGSGRARRGLGFWFNIGGETCASLTVNEDGTVSLMAGTPDIGGLRASLTNVVADELGIPYDKVRPIIGDTGSLGFTFLTGGSRSAFSGSMAIVEAAKQIKAELCARACKLWEAKPDQVEFKDGAVRPLGALAEKAKPMTIADFAKIAGKTSGGRSAATAGSTPRARPEPRHAPGRPRGRSGDGPRDHSCATRWRRMRAGRCIPRTSRGSSRAARCRGSAGR